jgi:hypothetical protein
MKSYQKDGHDKCPHAQAVRSKKLLNAADAEHFAEERKGVFSANLCENLRVRCG